MCIEHFQLYPVPLRWKSLISSLFSFLDSDIHMLSASRSFCILFFPPELLLSFTLHCAIFAICPGPSAIYVAWELGGFSGWNILSQSPQTNSRQIAACNALETVRSICVEFGSAVWLLIHCTKWIIIMDNKICLSVFLFDIDISQYIYKLSYSYR